MNNNYEKALIDICETILAQSNKYNLANHQLTKQYKKIIFKATDNFPEKITLAKRIKAIGNNDQCVCQNCGKIHGDIDSAGFCNQKCRLEYKSKNVITDLERKETLRIKSKEKYKNMIEGYDYIICKECGLYGAELTTHIKTHKMTPMEYKQKYNINSVKCQALIDSVSGKDNPGYQHGGKFSPFSEKFIHVEKTDIRAIKQKAAKNRADNDNNTTTVKYWLKKTDGDIKQANQLLSQRQKTFSLEICIEKYGEELGLTRWTKRQEKWLTTLSQKSPEELEVNKKKSSKINYQTLWKNDITSNGVLYLIKLPNNLFKIGVTTKNIFSRYKTSDLIDCKIIIDFNSTINHCFQIEQLIKRKFKSNVITKTEMYKNFGWTETFKDINEPKFITEINILIDSENYTTNLFKETFNLKYAENF